MEEEMGIQEEPIASPCPRCQGQRVHAELRVPGLGNYVFVEPADLDSDSLCLDAWLCPNCGHVELHAQLPHTSDSTADGENVGWWDE